MIRQLLRPFLISLIALTAVYFAIPASAQISDNAQSNFSRWFVMSLMGQPAGYVHEQVQVKNSHIITSQTQHMEVNRGGFTLTMDQKSKFIETKNHKPIKMVFSISMGTNMTTKTMTFGPNGRTLTVQRGTFTKTKKLPKIKSSWLTPAQEHAYLVEQIKKGTKKFSYSAIAADMGVDPVTKNFKRKKIETVKAYGKQVLAIAWDVTTSKTPGITIHRFTDLNGYDVRAKAVPIPGITLTMRWASKQLALAQKSPPKIVASLLIHPNKPINNPRALRQAAFAIHVSGKQANQIQLPQTGYQKVKRINKHNLIVTVDLDNHDSAADDQPTSADQTPSAMINGQDKLIISLTRQALGTGADKLSSLQKALLLRQAAHQLITTTNLSVGMASASEVAQTRKGDCTEHAVLLAAMLRAAGIPSRTVTGLIYVRQFLNKGNVFGYHMWTQGWIKSAKYPKGRWVDLDATLPAHGPPFDATHITLGTSSMASKNRSNDIIKMLPLFGRLKINVIKTSQN